MVAQVLRRQALSYADRARGRAAARRAAAAHLLLLQQQQVGGAGGGGGGGGEGLLSLAGGAGRSAAAFSEGAVEPLPCPPGVDATVWASLPRDLQVV